jgi:hypothetical protein
VPKLPISLYRSPFAGAKFTDLPLQIPPCRQMAKKKKRKEARKKESSFLMIYSSILGFVAFVVGGNGNAGIQRVELYSPDGNCQHNLSSVPVELYEPVLSHIDDKIFACGGNGNKNCFLYQPKKDSWSVYSTSTFTHYKQPGQIFNDKIYISDDENPEVLDPVTNFWSSWLAPLNKTEEGSCLVAWKDTFILL